MGCEANPDTMDELAVPGRLCAAMQSGLFISWGALSLSSVFAAAHQGSVAFRRMFEIRGLPEVWGFIQAFPLPFALPSGKLRT